MRHEISHERFNQIPIYAKIKQYRSHGNHSEMHFSSVLLRRRPSGIIYSDWMMLDPFAYPKIPRINTLYLHFSIINRTTFSSQVEQSDPKTVGSA